MNKISSRLDLKIDETFINIMINVLCNKNY